MTIEEFRNICQEYNVKYTKLYNNSPIFIFYNRNVFCKYVCKTGNIHKLTREQLVSMILDLTFC